MSVCINSGKGEVKERWLVKFGEILLKFESDSWKLLDGLINLVIPHNKPFSHDFSLPSTVFPYICAQLVESCSKSKTTLLRHRVWILGGNAHHVWSRSLKLDDIWSCPPRATYAPGFHDPCRQSEYQRHGQTVTGGSNPDSSHWTTNKYKLKKAFVFFLATFLCDLMSHENKFENNYLTFKRWKDLSNTF